MMKVLLISNRVMHYRSRIYNVFYDMFKEEDIEFHVVSDDFQEIDVPIRYVKHTIPFGFKAYRDFIRSLSPDICIFFLHLKDKMFLPLIHWCKMAKYRVIYWGHGINLKTPDATLKNLLFHHIHTLSDAIILYSPEQIKYISAKNRDKVFIANNTLCFDDLDLNGLKAPAEVKNLYGIKEEKILLYISRILPYKGLDILLELFLDTPELGLVIVGPGISSEQLKVVNETAHYYYLGERYGNEVDEIYKMGDIFSTPGHIGLALVQAMYWSKPVVVLNRTHAPEIIYLHQGENGFIVNTPMELKQTVLQLCHDKSLYERFSENARKTYEDEMQISVMFKGFMEAIRFVMN